MRKAGHFYVCFLGLSGNHTPNSPAGCVWKGQAAWQPGLSGWHSTRSSPTTRRAQSGHRTIDLGTMVPVTGHRLCGRFTLLSWVWNSTHSLCIILGPSPVLLHTPILTLPCCTLSHLTEAGDTKAEKVTLKHTLHCFTQTTSNGPGVRYNHLPQPVRQKPAFKKIQFRVTARQSWSPPGRS